MLRVSLTNQRMIGRRRPDRLVSICDLSMAVLLHCIFRNTIVPPLSE